jgi:hypothetical protein
MTDFHETFGFPQFFQTNSVGYCLILGHDNFLPYRFQFIRHPIIRRYSLNPLKLKLIYIILKNSARTSKKTPHFAITAINLL